MIFNTVHHKVTFILLTYQNLTGFRTGSDFLVSLPSHSRWVYTWQFYLLYSWVFYLSSYIKFVWYISFIFTFVAHLSHTILLNLNKYLVCDMLCVLPIYQINISLKYILLWFCYITLFLYKLQPSWHETKRSKNHTWPAPTIIIISIFILHIVAFVPWLRIDPVVAVTLQVGINNRHHLTSLTGHVVNHLHWVWKLIGIPSEKPVISHWQWLLCDNGRLPFEWGRDLTVSVCFLCCCTP